MTDEKTPNVAEAYVRQELIDARKSLRMTQIIGSIIVVAVALYMGSITRGFLYYMEPDHAVEIVSGMVTLQIDTHKDMFIDNVATEVPEMIQQAPELALMQVKNARQTLETNFEQGLRDFCKANAATLNGNIDDYLEKNKEKIQGVLEAGADADEVNKLGKTINGLVMDYMKEEPAEGGESIDMQLRKSLNMLKDFQKVTHKLATAKALTPAEKKTRRMIAIIANSVDEADLMELPLPKLGADDDDKAVEKKAPAKDAKGE